MSVRSDLAAALADVLPNNYRVVPYAKSLDRVEKGKPVVMVYRSVVEPASTFGHLTNEMAVWVIHPELNPGAVDDVLDDSLDVVLAALDLTRLTTWSRAERDRFDDAFPAYRVTCETTSTKEI